MLTKMMHMKKRFAVAVLAAVVSAGVMLLPVQAVRVNAASQAYMKKANVKWDLKKNKTITYKTKIDKIGMKKAKIRITKYKIKDSKMKGYKELNYTVRAEYMPLTSKEVHKLGVSGYQDIMNNYTAVVDYDTGKALSKGNKKKVTVTYGGWKIGSDSTQKRYEDSDGCVVIQNSYQEINVKVVYPKNYKGLCIGVGGSTSWKSTENNKKFWNGKTVLGKTTYCSKKNKSVAHFMRVAK